MPHSAYSSACAVPQVVLSRILRQLEATLGSHPLSVKFGGRVSEILRVGMYACGIGDGCLWRMQVVEMNDHDTLHSLGVADGAELRVSRRVGSGLAPVDMEVGKVVV